MLQRPEVRFVLRVLPAALLGLAIRVVYVTSWRHHAVIGDAYTFHFVAQALVDGHGFVRVYTTNVPTAEHPPMQELLLALNDVVGNRGYFGQELFMCLVGTGTVVAVAFLGRAVAGERSGLLAGLLAACYPLLWVVDGTLLSETPYMLLITCTLLAGYAFANAPTWRRAVALGVLIGLATLTRGEAILLLVLLAAPLAWRAAPAWRTRALRLGAVVLACCVVLAPWTIRNIATFKDPTAVLIADDSDTAIAGANCEPAYHGSLLGSWTLRCLDRTPPGDESQSAAAYRTRGVHYLRHHLRRLPVVLLARVGRLLDVWRPTQSAVMAAYEGRQFRVELWGIRVYWVVALAAIAGAAVLRRRGQRLQILAAPLAMVVLTSIAAYGATRFRAGAEPAIVTLAAVAVDGAVPWAQARFRARRPVSAA